MGKATGFLEYPRESPPARDPEERISDWEEFYQRLPEERLKEQGARCMDCGIPFCHGGLSLEGIKSGCPINNLIPEWNDLVYRGLWRDALERLHKTNNFPEFTGRVCPAPCEAACVLGISDPAVTIKSIECAIVDKGFEEGWIRPEPPLKKTGRTVAVIGSGPAGLACAAQLNRAGHKVTVYERADRIGGLLMYGIPNMKLDKSLVDRRVKILREEGIDFRTRCDVGRNISAIELMEGVDALVLCTGATVPRDLPIEGRDLEGIHFAMEYLQASTASLLDHEPLDPALTAAGKDVIVIGGGDTGTDCVGTAMRQGCKSLTQFEILPRPPNQRAPDNPWPEWPQVYFLDYGQQEAAAVFGQDPRYYSIMTQCFEGDDTDQVQSLLTIDVEWVKENGRHVPKEIPESERKFDAQLVLLAMGFLGPEAALLQQLQIETESSLVKAEHGSFQTSLGNVFAAGDNRRGQSLIVWAINEGRGAAREVDRFLMGSTNLP